MTRGSSATSSSTDRIAPEWVADGKRHGRRSKLLWGAVAVMAAVVVGLVLYQVLITPSAPPKVTITSVRWNVTQGTVAGGPQGWFGPNQFNYTGADGYPLNVSPGGTFGTSWAFINYDQYNHTIRNVTANPPFRVVATQPVLPAMAPAGFDDGELLLTIQVPNTPGTVSALYLNVTID